MPKPTFDWMAQRPQAAAAVMAAGANPDGSLFQLTVNDIVAELAATGVVKTVGTGVINGAVAGNVRITLGNPAGSGVMATIVGIMLASTVNGFGRVYINPAAGLPGGAAKTAYLNALAGAEASYPLVSQLKADMNATTALSGGYDTGVVLGVGAGRPREVDLPGPVLLPPGVTLGVGVNLGAAFELAANIIVMETPL